ncbi:MAG: hypothetical protein AB1782_14100 [Cyanobacteriota bacterium]
MNKFSKGNSLSQYAIIIAIIAVVLIPLFFIMGNNIYDNFNNFNKTLGNKKIAIQTNLAQTTTSNPSSTVSTTTPDKLDLGGTPETPVRTCKNALCTIDYGEFILQGVPEDLNDYLQSSGNSGTTDFLSSLLDQIVSQVANLDTSVDIDLIQKLANEGHAIAALEKQLEEESAKISLNPEKDLSSKQEDLFDDIGDALEDGNNINNFNNYLKQINSQLTASNTSDDERLKILINLLSGEIKNLANHVSVSADNVGIISPDMNAINNVLKPNASLNTNLDSAIICVADDNVDTDNKCN